MKTDSANGSNEILRTRRFQRAPLTLATATLAALSLVLTPSLSGGTRAQTVNYCQLLKDPSSFDGKLIRITGVYLYSFETRRLLPSNCCEDRDTKTWVEFGQLDRRSRRLVRHFPEGTGMVLATFVGKLDYGSYRNSQFKLTVTAVETVERVAKGSEIKKSAWAPPFCKQ